MVSPEKRRELDEKIDKYMEGWRKRHPEEAAKEDLMEDTGPYRELTPEEHQQIIDGLEEMTQMLRDMNNERRN